MAQEGKPHLVLMSLWLFKTPFSSTYLSTTSIPSTAGLNGLGYFLQAALATVSHECLKNNKIYNHGQEFSQAWFEADYWPLPNSKMSRNFPISEIYILAKISWKWEQKKAKLQMHDSEWKHANFNNFFMKQIWFTLWMLDFFNTIRVSNSLDPDQARHFVGPDRGPNCL